MKKPKAKFKIKQMVRYRPIETEPLTFAKIVGLTWDGDSWHYELTTGRQDRFHADESEIESA